MTPMFAQELITQRSVEELGRRLRDQDPVVYRTSGNRATDGTSLLKRVRALLPAIGVTRVAEISQLAPLSFPVYQSTRPNLHHHAAVGQNSGAQGKGPTRTQALLSCLMETVEGFCAEPRNVHLVRGSYRYLRAQHALLDPRLMIHRPATRPPAATEPLLWTRAYHVESDASVLVPAEAVYGYLLVDSYGTRPIFPSSSNGTGAGATYLEAVNHGLYEVIERMYLALAAQGRLTIEALFESGYAGFDVEAFNGAERNEFELQLFALKCPRLRNLPMVVCYLVGDRAYYRGYGCGSDVDIAIMRAISEALQSYAGIISGSREDIARQASDVDRHEKSLDTPRRRTLAIDRYRTQAPGWRFTSLQKEYRALVRWVHDAGYRNICIANLTRTGVEIPVVKVMVPGMPTLWRGFGGNHHGWTIQQVLDQQFSLPTP